VKTEYLIAGAVFAAAAVSTPVRAQQGRIGGPVGIDTGLTEALTDTQEHLTQDASYLLRMRRDGRLPSNSLTVSGLFKAGYYYEQTDSAGKYPILSRFPNQHGTGKDNSEFVINVAAVSLTGTLTDWITAYGQLEYSEINFARDQDEVQLREYYAVLGNLDVFGGYLAYGRKTVDFGEQFGYNPFTHTINQHFFWTLADEPVLELGYVGDTWRVSGTLAEGERMLRVGMSTDRDGGLGANFALKAEKSFLLEGDRSLRVSASYLDGTIYNNNFTAHTLASIDRPGPPNAPLPPNVYIAYENGAWDLGAEYLSPRFDLAVEYTRSTDIWPATSFNTDTGEKYDGARDLDALSIMGRYKTEIVGFRTDFSAVWSQSILGPEDTEFDDVYQHVLGAEIHINPYLDLGAEIVFNEGFQPFVGIQDVSISSVQSQVGILGVTARF